MSKAIDDLKFQSTQVVTERITRIMMHTKEMRMLEMLPEAAKKARPLISNYHVGAVGLTEKGNLLFGVNLEFYGLPLTNSVHAEQFLTILALSKNEKLVSMAVSAEPCGYCRQFLNEIKDGENLDILVVGKTPKKLKELLPESFGPKNLGITSSLFCEIDNKLKLRDRTDDALILQALKSANRSYSPYTNSPSGVAMLTKDGKIFDGFYIENAAFNPSVSPMLSAIVTLVAEDRKYDEVVRVVLVEKQGPKVPVQHVKETELFIKAVMPKTKFEVYEVYEN